MAPGMVGGRPPRKVIMEDEDDEDDEDERPKGFGVDSHEFDSEDQDGSGGEEQGDDDLGSYFDERDEDDGDDDDGEDEDDDDDDFEIDAGSPAGLTKKKEKVEFAAKGDAHGGSPEDDDRDEQDDDVPLASLLARKGRTSLSKVETCKMARDADDDFDLPLLPLSNKKRDANLSGNKSIKKEPRDMAKRSARGGDNRPGKRKRLPEKKEDKIPVRKFELIGQRRETPGKNEPMRLFYESMYHEKRQKGLRSDLAEGWMLTHGLLEPKTAEEVYDRLNPRVKSAKA